MKHTRRQFLGSLVAGVATVGVAAGIAGVRAGSSVQLPTSQANNLKAGPLGLNPAAEEGEVPVAIVIPDAEVDAEVERNKIVDGKMLDPSGPWVVSWYEGTGLVGERDNAVMSGHVDYWDVGPAVFRAVASLPAGALIDVEGENGTTYTYAVEYVERVIVAELTPEKINEIVGRTDYAALTLITCGGEFNYETGEYLQRDIIRARLTGSAGGQEAAAPAGQADEAAAGQTPEAAGERAGDASQTTVASDVNLRASASTSAEIVRMLPAGEVVTITGEPQDADGFTWVPVRLADGTEGWVVQDGLTPGQ